MKKVQGLHVNPKHKQEGKSQPPSPKAASVCQELSRSPQEADQPGQLGIGWCFGNKPASVAQDRTQLVRLSWWSLAVRPSDVGPACVICSPVGVFLPVLQHPRLLPQQEKLQCRVQGQAWGQVAAEWER